MKPINDSDDRDTQSPGADPSDPHDHTGNSRPDYDEPRYVPICSGVWWFVLLTNLFVLFLTCFVIALACKCGMTCCGTDRQGQGVQRQNVIGEKHDIARGSVARRERVLYGGDSASEDESM